MLTQVKLDCIHIISILSYNCIDTMRRVRNKQSLQKHKYNPSNINICLNFNEEYTICHEKSSNHQPNPSKSKVIQPEKTIRKFSNRPFDDESQQGQAAFSPLIMEETMKKRKEIYATIDYPYNISKNNQRKNKAVESNITKKSKSKKEKIIMPYDFATIQFNETEDFNKTQSAIITQTHRTKMNENEKRSQIKKKRRKSKLSSDQLVDERIDQSSTNLRGSDRILRKYPQTIQVDKVSMRLKGKVKTMKHDSKKEQKIDLKKKLQTFRVDIIKLASFYEQQQLINSKKTVQADQKAFFKHKDQVNLNFIHQPDLSRQFYEIHEYQTNKGSFNTALPQRDEEQMSFKDKENVSSQLSRLCELGKLFTKSQQQQNGEELSQNNLSEKSVEDKMPQDSFINDLLKKYQDLSKEEKEKLKQLFQAFQKQHQKVHKNQEKQINAQQNIVQVPIQDILINRQIEVIREKKTQFSNEFYLNELEKDRIAEWEENYRKQLINIKKKMWSQYKVLKSLADRKVNKPASTQSSSKWKNCKIMKCLSEKVFSRNTHQAQNSTPSMNGTDQQKLISYQFSNSRQPDYFRKKNELLPTLINIQNDSNDGQSEDEIIHWNIQPAYFQNKSNQPLLQQQQPFRIKLHEITINTQEKQDICEVIFIDLILQLYEKELIKQLEGNQGQTGQNRIYSKLKEWIIKSKERSKKRIGFCTNINAVQAICTRIVGLLASQIKICGNAQNIRQNILKQLNFSAGPTQLELLAALRFHYDKQQPVMHQNLDDIQAVEILDSEVFNYFEFEVIKIKQLQFNQYYHDQEKQKQRVRFLRNSVHIHNKAIFDSLGENLQFQRRYKSWGKPFCWRTTILHSDKEINNSQVDKILAKANELTIGCANHLCGLLVDKQDSLVAQITTKTALLAQLQEDRMQKMLQKYVEQSNQRWTRFDDQEAETELEVCHLIWRQLLHQLLQELPL